MPMGVSSSAPATCLPLGRRPARDASRSGAGQGSRRAKSCGSRSLAFEIESGASSMPAPPSERLLPELFPGLTLRADERLLASLHLDVDDQLRFSPGLLLLSDAHLHVRHSGGFHSIPITRTLTLRRHEHAGLTELSFFDAERRVLTVRYTL